MSLRFSEEVVIRVWKNINNKVGLPTSHFGHAAASIRGSLVQPIIDHENKGDYMHISWWPASGAGKSLEDAFGFQGSDTNDDYFNDARSEIGVSTRWNLEFYRLATTQGQGGNTAFQNMMGDDSFGNQVKEAFQEVYQRAPEPAEYQAAFDEFFNALVKTDENDNFTGYAPKTLQKYRRGSWVVSADEKVYLPGLGRAQETGDVAKQMKNAKSAVHVCPMRYFGVSTWRMARWWEQFRQDNRYRLASKTHSCAGVAAVALQEGGGEAYQAKPSVSVWMAPNDIHQWAEQIAARVNDLDRKASQFRQQVAGVIEPRYLAMLPRDLWPYDTWQRQSSLKHKPRSGMIRAIGDALKKYHSVSWNNPAGFKEKLKQLVIVMDNATTHFHQKQHSGRRVAVAALAYQGIHVLNSDAIKKT